MPIDAKLQPARGKALTSVARVTRAWYVAAFSHELGRRPLARTILGQPLVLFRRTPATSGATSDTVACARAGADAAVAAVLDRCPHRNVPLSAGRVVDGELECAYHGWRFGADGACTRVPGLVADGESRGRRVEAFPAVERDGFVWVWLDAESEPDCEPFRFPLQGERGYTSVRRMVEAEGTMHAMIENALDVPHTAYLHKGLFRGVSEPNEIDVVVRRGADRVEAEYVGEPRPEGLLGRLLSPSGGLVVHFDRFVLPSILQVEYRIGDENHVLVTGACTPVTDFHTRMYAEVMVRSRLPGWLVTLGTPLGLKVFAQDAAMLALQTRNIERFGGEQFESTENDVLGGEIWRLLRRAERRVSADEDETSERRLKLRA